ncbi:MAG: peptide-methionine (S)-S-oxide reductase MsrA [Pelagibacteraceae bacterium]|jgi:peptide-methionine (S)-S-oxide reductase
MHKYFIILIFLFPLNIFAGIQTVYLAGGCFWCMEEAYQDLEGVDEVVSGFSGGHVINPTYMDVVKGNTGHIETVKIDFDDEIISLNQIIKIFFLNIDPFDPNGQFCDKGYSYRSAIFINSQEIETISKQYLNTIKKNHKDELQVLLLPFENFYEAEDYHQDYYRINPIRYTYYKFSCGREQRIKQIKINLL